MSDTDNTAVTAEPAKKSTKKANKKPAKKAHESNGTATKEKGLSKRQIAVLDFLAEATGLPTLNDVAEKVYKGHKGHAFNDMGPADPDKQAATAARPGCRPGLLMLGHVTTKVVPSEGTTDSDGTYTAGRDVRVYKITASGKKALAKANKAAAE